jgi:LruC domain-containing protein
MKTLFRLHYLVIVALFVISCNKDPKPDNSTSTMEQLNVPESFNWSTSKTSIFSITALDNQDNPIKNVRFSIYTADPELGGKLIVSGVTDIQGKYVVNYQVPAYYTTLFIGTDYLGLPNSMEVDLSESGFDVVYGGKSVPVKDKPVSVLKSNTTFKYLGTYNSNGVPNYLEPVNDPVTSDFLADINNTLPERVQLPVSHPQYLLDVYNHNLNLIETCDVWVTFVHEGATYRNVLGFYTYTTGDTPATPADIDSVTIIFPNASLSGSGGGLQSGNKVYLGQFNANTTIAWALIANGWVGGQVTNGYWMVYSDKNLNPAPEPNRKQQSVFLYDPGRERLLLGIEDIRRNSTSCDHDFNDAVFFVTANPIQAVDLSVLPIIDYVGEDDDDDGVNNNFDDYPFDPDKAFDNWFFSEGNFGSLAFEDLWPYRGDYDFNDAVIDYNFNQITNGSNQVVELNAKFILRAHGAYYHNGFGIELPIASSLIQSVTGTNITNDYITFNSNNTESGQSNAVIIAWDDSYEVLPPVSSAIGVNTTPDVPFVIPDTLDVSITFTNPIPLNVLGVPPYNPFIIVNQLRGVEVHLPNKAPTSLADLSLLGTGHDNSIPESGRYYKTQNNLPWGINIIERFDYPNEKTEVIAAHLHFAEWAESGGYLFTDWYHDASGYRDDSKIYIPTP